MSSHGSSYCADLNPRVEACGPALGEDPLDYREGVGLLFRRHDLRQHHLRIPSVRAGQYHNRVVTAKLDGSNGVTASQLMTAGGWLVELPLLCV